jgi:hypothetical protein
MAVEALCVRYLHAAEDEFAPRNQLMNVIADAHMNHERNIAGALKPERFLCKPSVSG